MASRVLCRLLRPYILLKYPGKRTNELLTGKAIVRHPLESASHPFLIFTNEIVGGLCLAHPLRGFLSCAAPDVASLEPSIGKLLHIVEEPVLNVPETDAGCP